MAAIAASWRTIEAVLWENAHSVFRALRGPVTDAQLARLGRVVPARLPRDFVQSHRTHDGLRNSYLGLNRLFDYYALMPVSAIIAEHKILWGLQAQDPVGGRRRGRAKPAKKGSGVDFKLFCGEVFEIDSRPRSPGNPAFFRRRAGPSSWRASPAPRRVWPGRYRILASLVPSKGPRRDPVRAFRGSPPNYWP
jgi:hypothetical protein